MIKYLKAIYHIFINYNFYSFIVIFKELEYFIKFNSSFNNFKYLKSDFLSDSIPCSYYFLIKIKKFVENKNIKSLCDLGSGYGKILYYFGKILNYKIDGIEIDNEIYRFSKQLTSKNIKIFKNNILEYNLNKKNYDLIIVNDPLKKLIHFNKLVKKIRRSYKMIKFAVFINLSNDKIQIVKKNLIIIDKFLISKNKNIVFTKIA